MELRVGIVGELPGLTALQIECEEVADAAVQPGEDDRPSVG